jgi:tetratricopeptide (TPR) repeat protein
MRICIEDLCEQNRAIDREPLAITMSPFVSIPIDLLHISIEDWPEVRMRSPILIVPSNSIPNLLKRIAIAALLDANGAILLGHWLIDLGDYPGAIVDFNQAISLKGFYPEAYISLGISRAKLGDFQGAIDAYSQAIQLDPDLAIAYYNRGILHAQLGNYQKAIANFTAAIELDPNYAEAYFNRGAVRNNQLGDIPGAIVDLQTAADLYLQRDNPSAAQHAFDQLRAIRQ